MSDLPRPLARNNDGSVVHAADCRHARVPWNWADRKPDWEVIHTVQTASWLRFCGVCITERLER